jgi:phosphoenolpyruvate carboxykinase (ATP)
MKLAYTRRMVDAALTGELDSAETYTDPYFNLHVPVSIEGIPGEVLRPRDTWTEGEAYDAQAKKLAGMFIKNFEQFSETVSEDVIAAGPPR